MTLRLFELEVKQILITHAFPFILFIFLGKRFNICGYSNTCFRIMLHISWIAVGTIKWVNTFSDIITLFLSKFCDSKYKTASFKHASVVDKSTKPLEYISFYSTCSIKSTGIVKIQTPAVFAVREYKTYQLTVISMQTALKWWFSRDLKKKIIIPASSYQVEIVAF